MIGWIDQLADCQARERPCVLVTLLTVQGSSPREPGAKMVVTADSVTGTLGGGTVEHIAQQRARALLSEGPGAGAPAVEEFVLNDALDQACGGRIQVLFEPVWPSTFQIALFGAGHVGQALVRALQDLPCRVRWVDARADIFPDRMLPHVKRIVAERPQAEVNNLRGGTFVVVMTHSHDTDLEIVDAALRRPDLPFVGSIGSKSKRARFRSLLAERGLDQAAIDRLLIPIGMPGVGGKRPSEIAIAIAAQLLLKRDEAARG